MDISVIGTIYNNDGVYDDEGNVVTAPTAKAGFHVNTTELPLELEQYAVQPVTPYRVFAGGTTHYLTFANEAEFKAVMAAWLAQEEYEGDTV